MTSTGFEIMNVIIDTARLIMRPLRPEDISQIYLDGLNDPLIIGMTEARHRYWDHRSASEFIEAVQTSESILLGVFLKDDGKNIGNIRVFNRSRHRWAELSFLFFDPQEWGKGYATEALNAAIIKMAEAWFLHKICADYYETNHRSARVFEKLNFEVVGRFPDHFLTDNGFVDSIRVSKKLSTS